VNTLGPKPKKSKLGQFHPETRMHGRWIGGAGISCLVGSFILGGLRSIIPGMMLAICAAVLGKIGLDSKGRIFASIALIGGVLFTGIFITVLIVGRENIDAR